MLQKRERNYTSKKKLVIAEYEEVKEACKLNAKEGMSTLMGMTNSVYQYLYLLHKKHGEKVTQLTKLANQFKHHQLLSTYLLWISLTLSF